MSDLTPLFYLEARMAVQKFKHVLRQPARLTLWIVFVIWFVAFLITRAHRIADGQYALALPQGARLFFAFVPAIYAAILGMQIRSGARRPPAAFAYPADARFLFGSRLSHAAVIFWLQLREAAYQGIRVLVGLFFLSWNFAASAGGFLHASATLLFAFVIAFGIRLPVFLTQRRLPRIPFAWLGAALIGCAALAVLYPLGLGVASQRLSLAMVAALTPPFPPGTWIVDGLAGSTPAALLLAALACATVIASSLAAADSYPEIWEASSRQYARRSLVASGRGLWNRELWRTIEGNEGVRPHPVVATVPSLSGEHAPTGALTVLWREWIALQRSAGGLRWPLFWIACAAVLGFLAGIAERGRPVIDVIVPLVAIANIVIVIGSQSTISLGSELRRPIFWLGDSTLYSRVLAWIAGTTLRIGPPLVAGAVMAGIAIGSPLAIVCAGPIIIVGLFLVQCIGVASYVALPGRNDMRGPGFMLRVFTTYTSLGLPAIGWALVQSLTQNALAGVVAGLGIATLEAWMLLAFSAARLEENAMAYAAAEEH